jgi:serine/threonine-protein kinase
VERLLLRCLESDPNLRPRSAREVYEALPGGDRLAAALAAGETPSPRAVAAAGVEGALSPRVAWSILGAIAAMVAVILLVAQPWSVDRIAAMEIPPAALEARAIEIGKAIGIAPQRFRVSGCFARHDYESWLGDQSRAGLRARSVRGFALVAMRVRESPAPITPVGLQPLALDDPPQTQPGEATIDVDMSGRLAGLQAVPRAGPPAAVDWQQVLALTGVAPSSVRPTPPLQTPPVYADTRVAWNAWYPTAPDVPVHIEAAAAAGRTVWLKIGGDWEKDKSRRNVIFAGPALTGVAMALLGGVIVLLLLLAWNNYRKRRGDRAGAMRVASVIFVLEAITYQLLARHQLNAGHELVILTQTATASLFTAAMFAFIYLTLEPYVRRTWPERVISWSRLVGGNLRDPMVGRDILLGLAAGVAHAFVANCANLPAIVRGETLVPHIHPWQVTSAAEVLGVITNDVSGSALTGLLFVFVLVALTIVLRRRSWAVAALVLLQVAAFTAASRGKIPVLIGFLVITAIYTVTVLRVGLLGIAALQFAFSLMFQLPLPGAPGSWLFPLGFIPLIALVVLTLWAFRTSLGGQPAFNLD